MAKPPSLIYLYTSDRPPQYPVDDRFYEDYIKGSIPRNKFAQSAVSDGVIHMLIKLSQTDYVDKVHIFVDSKHGLGTMWLPHSNPDCVFHVVPDINLVASVVRKGDIFFVRGGFKPWLPLIKTIRAARQNWMLYYGANTSNSRWPFWDIIMDDLVEEPDIRGRIGKKRLVFPFSKPVNEDIFKPTTSAHDPMTKMVEVAYDICVGASHIHRKKGQYKTLQALELLSINTPLAKRPRAVLPGGMIRCVTNTTINEIVQRDFVPVLRVGAVSRETLCRIMNTCRFFVHSGVGGQNDRGVLEAMATGLPCLITSPKRFSPFVSRYPNFVAENDTVRSILDSIQFLLDNIHPSLESKLFIANKYKYSNGLHQVALPKMKSLINFIRNHPEPFSGESEWMDYMGAKPWRKKQI